MYFRPELCKLNPRQQNPRRPKAAKSSSVEIALGHWGKSGGQQRREWKLSAFEIRICFEARFSDVGVRVKERPF